MTPDESFEKEVANNISGLKNDANIKRKSIDWIRDVTTLRYAYNFRWLGRPIIQVPQDIVALQELIWSVKPDLIIETGIAHGGSLILSASMLVLLDYSDAIASGRTLDPRTTHRRVIGIDIDIRAHNRLAIQSHPMAHRIDLLQGSSIAPEIIAQVHNAAAGFERVLVVLDSNHTHEHVLAELKAYAPLTSPGSYCVVFDTVIEDLPDSIFPDRPWGKGDNPKTAVHEYLRQLRDTGKTASDGRPLNFAIDTDIESKLLITVAPDGYLRRV